MKRAISSEAEKKLTLLALKFSEGRITLKGITSGVIYAPEESLINVKGQSEAMVFHMCKPYQLVEALSSISDLKSGQCKEIWKRWCGIIFPHASDNLFCSKCFKEFDVALNNKITVIRVAGSGKLKL